MGGYCGCQFDYSNCSSTLEQLLFYSGPGARRCVRERDIERKVFLEWTGDVDQGHFYRTRVVLLAGSGILVDGGTSRGWSREFDSD